MKYTFGKTLAAQRLEILLDKNPIARRKISALLSKFSDKLLLVTGAKDPDTVRLCMDLLRDNTLKGLRSKKNLSSDVVSYAENVIKSRHRAFRQEFDYIVPFLKALDAKKANSDNAS